MESTKLWKIVQRMPKGALLHCHLGAVVDLAWVLETAIETKGICISAERALTGSDVREEAGVEMVFSRSGQEGGESIWHHGYVPFTLVPLKEAAESFTDGGREGFVEWMKGRCSITLQDSIQHHHGVDEVWRKMQGAFQMITPVIFYEPILRAFIRKFFLTLVEDRVLWVEMRGMSPRLRLEGQEGLADNPLELLRIVGEEIEMFKATQEGKNFWGARLIWDSLRTKTNEELVTGKLARLSKKQNLTMV